MEKNTEILSFLNNIINKNLDIKKLQIRLKSTGGRDYGKIIAPRKGELIKRIYRFIDFKRNFIFHQKWRIKLHKFSIKKILHAYHLN